MGRHIGRRQFIAGIGALAAATGAARGKSMESPFHIGIISDEISQDFGHACEVASKDFGMEYVELRELWGKNLFNLSSKELADAKTILEKSKLRVSDIASPLFKVDWPGAPRSKYSPTGDQFAADFTFDQQDDVLAHAIDLAKMFDCDRIRCFDFWRLDDPAPYRTAMNEKLLKAADKFGANGLVLVIENEPSCNTATGAESGKLLEQIKSPHFFLNWDPGNAAMQGEIAYPDGYSQIPKERIGHVHCKDVQKGADGKIEWAAMGAGTIDWVGQFRALKNDDYHHAMSLETHWRGAGSPEESSRQSWKGMKEELAKAGVL